MFQMQPGGLPALAGAGMPGAVGAGPGARPATFGPYQLVLDGRVISEFAVNALTGQPELLAATVDEGHRIRSFRNPTRART
jgi:hypothetical protein